MHTGKGIGRVCRHRPPTLPSTQQGDASLSLLFSRTVNNVPLLGLAGLLDNDTLLTPEVEDQGHLETLHEHLRH